MASPRSRRWVDQDPVAGTLAARTAFREQFADQVDPDRLLTDEDREKLAAAARRLHYQRMALLSAAARRRYSIERKQRSA